MAYSPRASLAPPSLAGRPAPNGRAPRHAGSLRGSVGTVALGVAALLAGCAGAPERPTVPLIRPADVRASIVRLLPPGTSDAQGWATDIGAAFAALRLVPTPDNLCAVIAVTEQESSFRVDPPVPGLAAIAWREIDRQAERAGVPRLVAHAALNLASSDGRSFRRRIDAAKTERELSEIFEDFVGLVPMGRTLLASRNPVRTGGPMQVGIGFAEARAARSPYPYPVDGSIRHEVFTRRGGMYFGIAHLLDYPVDYDRPLYRFADYNAGRYASRNAAFQNAVSVASGIPLVLDGDLLPPGADDDAPAGSTELAVRVLGGYIDLGDSAIHRDLARGDAADFVDTKTWQRVFDLAGRLEGKPLPRAVLPRITLHSPKITRKLTTAWFAGRVDQRHRRCLARAGDA